MARPSTPTARRSATRTSRPAARPTPSCSARAAGPSGTTSTRRSGPSRRCFALRKELGLFANLRPVTVPPRSRVVAAPARAARGRRPADRARADRRPVLRQAVRGAHDGADGREAVDTMLYTEAEIRRIVRLAFELARAAGARRSPASTSRTCWRRRASGARSSSEGGRGVPGRRRSSTSLVDSAAMLLITSAGVRST